MDKIVERALKGYCDNFKQQNLRFTALLGLTKFALHHGTPHGQEGHDENGQPVVFDGFEPACKELRSLSETFLQDVWIDTQSEEVFTEEPKPTTVEEENPDYDPEDENSEKFIRTQELNWDDFAFVESKTLKFTLFGSDLAPYI